MSAPNLLHVLLPASPLDGKVPDDEYLLEAEALKSLGVPYSLIDLEALEDGDGTRAVRRLKIHSDQEPIVYRGWMLNALLYQRLYDSVSVKGGCLVTTQDEYLHAHLLPGWYPCIEGRTPRSIWLPGERGRPLPEIMANLAVFGGRPVVLKDYVKSQKHYWREACYIDVSNDEACVDRVVKRFLELQGGEVTGGLVFREYIPLDAVGVHPTSGIRLGREYRFFMMGWMPFAVSSYWDGISLPVDDAPFGLCLEVVKSLRSRFVTIDVARSQEGRWLVMEVGDGQVSGLPGELSPEAFHRGLQDSWTSHGKRWPVTTEWMGGRKCIPEGRGPD